MPIQKFKSFKEAQMALWCYTPDEAYYKSAKDFWNTIERLPPLKKWPQGITKYKSTAEAATAKDNWLMTP